MRNSESADLSPLSLSVLVGGVGGLLPGPPRALPTPTSHCICLSWLGELLLIPGSPQAPPTLLYLSVLVSRDGFDQPPLVYPQLLHGPCSARESQLTLRIPTRIYSVGSPSTNSRSSHHDFYCNRNTTARPIQIEEKALSINYFIVQRN